LLRRTRYISLIAGLALFALLATACDKAGTLEAIPTEATSTAQAGVPTSRPTRSPALILGSSDNPLILALPPGTSDPDLIKQGQALADQLSLFSDYAVVTVIPDSYANLVKAMRIGNVHIAILPPLVYLLAEERAGAQASLTALNDGFPAYGAQFIARKGAFLNYFNPVTEKNTANAATALLQFNGKRPCLTEPSSPSGYVVPLGYLAEYGIQTQSPIILREHTNVVRAVYAADICDFGATYIDARSFPSLQQEHPDVLEQVVVIWRIPAIIPNETVAFAGSLPDAAEADLTKAFLQLAASVEGKATLRTVFQIEALEVANMSLYDEFRDYVQASGLELNELIR
jgi:phosphonate transport system substrate-binding protein